VVGDLVVVDVEAMEDRLVEHPARQDPRAMASLRNLAISVLRIDGITNIVQANRHHAWDPGRPVKLLLTI